MWQTRRNRRFWIIRNFLLQPLLVLLRILVWSYRFGSSDRERIRHVAASSIPVLGMLHGNVLALCAIGRVFRKAGRALCIMTSPSQDGLILDVVMKSFGLDVVKGSSKSKATGGTLALVRKLRGGIGGVLAVDGPRGPIGVPKTGFIRISAAAGAEAYCVTFSCKRYLQIRSWDRMFVPAPFSRISVRFTPIERKVDLAMPEAEVQRNLQRLFKRDAEIMHCPLARWISDPQEPAS